MRDGLLNISLRGRCAILGKAQQAAADARISIIGAGDDRPLHGGEAPGRLAESLQKRDRAPAISSQARRTVGRHACRWAMLGAIRSRYTRFLTVMPSGYNT